MAKLKAKYYVILWFAALIIFALVSAEPIPQEDIFTLQWIASLESSYPHSASYFAGVKAEKLIPVETENRFAYVDTEGAFSVIQTKQVNVSLSEDRWTSYKNVPGDVDIFSPLNEKILTLKNISGYPFFLNKRMFIVSYEQNTITELGDDGSIIWSYDFASPLTCVDASDSYFAAGLIDGSINLIDKTGKCIFYFEPGGSRIPVVTGIAISKDGNKIAAISGIDNQRFLLLEYVQDSYRVAYHEFLEKGFRENVPVYFMNNEKYIVFNRESSLGVYDIEKRKSSKIYLDGKLLFFKDGKDNMLFVITEKNETNKLLYVINYPDNIILNAPFAADTSFIDYNKDILIIGGNSIFAAFKIEQH
jgi:hypothetical protein